MKDVVAWRFYVSTALMVATAVVLITGILLYFKESGSSYIFGVIDKHVVEAYHKSSGIIMTLILILHMWLNFPMYKAEMLHVCKRRKEVKP